MSLTSYRAAPPRVTGGWGGDGVVEFLVLVLGRPGGDLLSHVLRRSTIGAEGFHGRVRDGIGCLTPRHSHQVVQARSAALRSKAAMGTSAVWREPSGESAGRLCRPAVGS